MLSAWNVEILHWICNSIAQIILTFIESVRCYDDILCHYIVEDISECVRSVSITPAETNKVTLDDIICKREIIKAGMKDLSDFTFMIFVDVIMLLIDLDFYFVEDRFSPNKVITSSRIFAPHNSWRSVHLYRKM